MLGGNRYEEERAQGLNGGTEVIALRIFPGK